MRFPQSFLDEIRDRVPISAVVGSRVSFDRKKSNPGKGDYWACCPFHGEKTPSFHCEDRKGRYHCFGCGVSGDHFRFLTELDGMPFPEAVERIAEMAGVPMPARDPEAERREQQRASLTDVMDMAARFFEEKLQSADGAKARAYLRGRELGSAIQREFRLGYAPDSRNALKEFLASKGVGKDQIEACGLVVHGPEIPVSYDRFRDRIMFPITDTRGRVIAFGGRAMSADVPAKYLNSPETELFHKGRVLYNHGPARRAAQEAGTVVAVEGYMDVIALAQAGIRHAVAPLGTALTEEQMDLLWRIGGEPILCFDGDQAGLKAAWRAADLILPSVKPGHTARFALLPEGQDPDDLIKGSGVDAMQAVLNEARPLADLIWMRETAGGVFDTPERRAELEKRLRDAVFRIQDESVRHHYLQDMRERAQSFFGAPPRRGPGERGRGNDRGGPRFGGGASSRFAVSESLTRSALVRRAQGGLPLREAVLVLSLANHPVLLDQHFEDCDQLDLESPDLRRLLAVLFDALAHGRAGNRDETLAAVREAGLGDVLDQADGLVRRARQWTALGEAASEDAREGFLQALHLHRSARGLHKELKAAELALASEPTDANYRRLLDIQDQMRQARTTEAIIDGFGVASGRGRVRGSS
ncbi:DNA primase [Zhengella mangrovi]|uniref:DNA primase n=1 Tax=Zhengella mangrovi TaxID=1982044 RepID=A0A2G1QHE3_9HYPH|nr:DNA primase [Zhengella mangrovi]PHP64880.1 DNA primase [Zhengella mangrovi]